MLPRAALPCLCLPCTRRMLLPARCRRARALLALPAAAVLHLTPFAYRRCRFVVAAGSSRAVCITRRRACRAVLLRATAHCMARGAYAVSLPYATMARASINAALFIVILWFCFGYRRACATCAHCRGSAHAFSHCRSLYAICRCHCAFQRVNMAYRIPARRDIIVVAVHLPRALPFGLWRACVALLLHCHRYARDSSRARTPLQRALRTRATYAPRRLPPATAARANAAAAALRCRAPPRLRAHFH